MSSFSIFNKTPKKITVFLPNVAHHTFYPMIASFLYLITAKINKETISFIHCERRWGSKIFIKIEVNSLEKV